MKHIITAAKDRLEKQVASDDPVLDILNKKFVDSVKMPNDIYHAYVKLDTELFRKEGWKITDANLAMRWNYEAVSAVRTLNNEGYEASNQGLHIEFDTGSIKLFHKFIVRPE